MQRNEFSRSFLKSRVNNSTLLKCLLVIPALNFPFFFPPVGIANGPAPKLNFFAFSQPFCARLNGAFPAPACAAADLFAFHVYWMFAGLQRCSTCCGSTVIQGRSIKPYFHVPSSPLSDVLLIDFTPSSPLEAAVPSPSLFRHTRTPLCSLSSLLYVENQGRQHTPAIPPNQNAPFYTQASSGLLGQYFLP